MKNAPKVIIIKCGKRLSFHRYIFMPSVRPCNIELRWCHPSPGALLWIFGFVWKGVAISSFSHVCFYKVESRSPIFRRYPWTIGVVFGVTPLSWLILPQPHRDRMWTRGRKSFVSVSLDSYSRFSLWSPCVMARLWIDIEISMVFFPL